MKINQRVAEGQLRVLRIGHRPLSNLYRRKPVRHANASSEATN
jgi:hypothetical protein